MDTQNTTNESSTDNHQSDDSSTLLLNLKNPAKFVYVISILAGLAAGTLLALVSWRQGGDLFSLPNLMGFIGLLSGAFGGKVAAWFWTKRMTFHVRNHATSFGIAILGVIWGLFAGWLAAAIFWIALSPVLYAMDQGSVVRIILVIIHGVGIFGSIGGLGAGIICGGAWAIWTRPGK
ncbi:MAG: hypothetical protein JXA11_15835 [Phycisphaerae bacterium]|nr:hypothetical protein [Phycisphaerae bacterium]